MSRPFLPSARQTNWLLVIGFSSVGYALYLRYQAIEQSTFAISCQGGLQTWMCLTRKTAIALFQNDAFGWAAIAAAVLNLLRPSIVLFALALSAAGFGIVLYNTALSALATGLLLISLARPAPETE